MLAPYLIKSYNSTIVGFRQLSITRLLTWMPCSQVHRPYTHSNSLFALRIGYDWSLGRSVGIWILDWDTVTVKV